MEYARYYFWVVVCKNQRFHHKANIGYTHKIPLGEAGVYGARPMLPETIKVRCNSCGKEYSYEQEEVMRDEVQIPEAFVPHPLFKLL